ncbi:MAG: hypothetical protein H6818_17190 [Phycisphaerales bacterium]|nr:hypothetical protein [Phycisphaerales bacterium]
MSLVLAHSLGCAHDARPALLQTRAIRAIESGDGLHVAFVANNDFGSGTPITATTVIASAHGFDNSGPIAAVDGYPMKARHISESSPNPSRRVQDDWMILESTRARFKCNDLCRDVSLAAGRRVLVAGYRASELPIDLKRLGEFTPELIEGRVMDRGASTQCPDAVVPIRVPHGDYIGFSGGPAAVLGPTGTIQVFGIIVELRYRRSVIPPWRRYVELWAVRLPAPTSVDVTPIQ